MKDRIHIRDLVVSCIIGTREKERRYKQNVVVNLVIETDMTEAAASDRIEDTVDYVAVKGRIVAHVRESSCLLLERLAAEIADICLHEARVCGVTVTIDKPGALTKARSVAVEIRRTRSVEGTS